MLNSHIVFQNWYFIMTEKLFLKNLKIDKLKMANSFNFIKLKIRSQNLLKTLFTN